MSDVQKFASRHLHSKLYEAYDAHQDIWKACLYGYWLSRFEGYGEDVYTPEVIESVTKSIIHADYPYELETCEYFFEKRMSKAIRYSKHGACQWMAMGNLMYAQKFLTSQNWKLIANEGDHAHHYVLSDTGLVLDPQGIALDFLIDDYRDIFDTASEVPEKDVEREVKCHLHEYRELAYH